MSSAIEPISIFCFQRFFSLLYLSALSFIFPFLHQILRTSKRGRFECLRGATYIQPRTGRPFVPAGPSSGLLTPRISTAISESITAACTKLRTICKASFSIYLSSLFDLFLRLQLIPALLKKLSTLFLTQILRPIYFSRSPTIQQCHKLQVA